MAYGCHVLAGTRNTLSITTIKLVLRFYNICIFFIIWMNSYCCIS